jgi:ABC-type transport system substrate-binding protein
VERLATVRHRWLRHLVFGLVLALAAAACGSGGSSGKSTTTQGGGGSSTTEATATKITMGGSMTFGMEADLSPGGLLPGIAAQPPDRVVTLGIYDTLMGFDKDNKLVPSLAKSLQGSDDLLTWSMELNSGVLFHDDTPLNAEAITKHFDRLKDPATGCGCQVNIANITSMDTTDGATGMKVVFHLAKPDVAFGALLAGSSGYIESPTAMANDPKGFATKPIGTGPFTLKEYTPNDKVVLAKWAKYWKSDDQGNKLPYLDEVIFRPIPDTGQRLASLKAGDIQMYQSADTTTVVEGEKAGFASQRITGSSSTIILMNEKIPPFNNVKARQALAYAINRKAMNDRIYGGARVESYSSFAPDSPYFNKKATQPKYDADKAKALVNELGGLKFKLECIPTPEAQQIVELVKQMGENVGMQIELSTQDQGPYVDRILVKRTGDYQAACFRNNHFIEPDQIRTGLTTDDTGNTTFYSNKTVDRLLQEGRSTSDFAERKKAYDEVQVIITKEIPSITLLYDLFGNVYDATKVGPPPPGEPNSLGAIRPGFLHLK